MSFVTENMMKSDYEQIKVKNIKINNLDLNMIVYKTPKGLVFEIEQIQSDGLMNDNFVTLDELFINYQEINKNTFRNEEQTKASEE